MIKKKKKAAGTCKAVREKKRGEERPKRWAVYLPSKESFIPKKGEGPPFGKEK